MMYELFETSEFLDCITQLQKRDQNFVRNKLENYVYPQISEEPHFGINIKKLKNYTPATWRYRIGRFRVFYTIDEMEKIVLLLFINDNSLTMEPVARK